MTDGTRAGDIAGRHQDMDARTTAWMTGLCVFALVWIAWGVHESSVRYVEAAEAGRSPVRMSPARTSIAEWMLLPGIGSAIATRLDLHRSSDPEAVWRDATGWRLDRVRGVGRVIQSDVAPDLDPWPSSGEDR